MDLKKDRESIVVGVFMGAIFTSIEIGVIFGIGRMVIGWSLLTKRAMLFGKVIFCISEGLFMVSLFAAIYLLMQSQLKWVAIGVTSGVVVIGVVILAIVYRVLELYTGTTVGFTPLACLAFRFGGLTAVLIISLML
ncbi:hypothetical protein SUGI_1147990 [Cryptomeria japonica]|nr:hypothetical protein SUGI_1147990 [Cryptomeria japonica]